MPTLFLGSHFINSYVFNYFTSKSHLSPLGVSYCKKNNLSKGSSGKALIIPLINLLPPFRLPLSHLLTSALETPIFLASSAHDQSLLQTRVYIYSLFGVTITPPLSVSFVSLISYIIILSAPVTYRQYLNVFLAKVLPIGNR